MTTARWLLYVAAGYGVIMFVIQVAWWLGVRVFLGIPLR